MKGIFLDFFAGTFGVLFAVFAFVLLMATADKVDAISLGTKPRPCAEGLGVKITLAGGKTACIRKTALLEISE